MNVLVCGAGAFGRNHLRVWRELQQQGQQEQTQAARLAAVVESDAARAAELRAEAQEQGYALAVFASVGECLAARDRGEVVVHAASVCVPTSAHFSVASELLAAGIDVLVEKPIAATAEEADRLIALAAQHGRVLQVGHLERFNPAVTAIEPHLDGPMFFEVHRLSIFSPRALDVDVVLDLMVHDLDIVLSFAKSPVRELHAVGLPILSGKVDIANVRVEFESGCVANFTASRVSTERVRKMRFFQPHQYVSLDYARQDLFVIDVTGPSAALRSGAVSPQMLAMMAAQAQQAEGQSRESLLPPGLSLKRPEVRPGEPLRLEIESFLECVQERKTPRVSGEDGRRALALALDINAAIAAHAERAGLGRFSKAANRD